MDETRKHDYPVCSQKGCEAPAIFEYVWTNYQYACAEHMQKVLGIAAVMGFPTPKDTMRMVDWNAWADKKLKGGE